MVIAHYTNANRYDHNTKNIVSMVDLAQEYAQEILNKTNFYLAVFFHDIIYDISCSDNEERSTKYASDDLQKLYIDK